MIQDLSSKLSLSLPHSRESLTNEDISVYNDTLSEYVEEYLIIPIVIDILAWLQKEIIIKRSQILKAPNCMISFLPLIL